MFSPLYHYSRGYLSDFLASYAVTSLKIRYHYIAANLIVVVLSAEDCLASSMKLWAPKNVVLFVDYLSIILTLSRL